MFTDKSSEPTGFTSEISTEKSEKTANVQTEIVVFESKDSQKTELRSAATQTIESTKPTVQVDYEKLAAFMKRITPTVIEVLDEVYGNNAFQGYNPSSSNQPTDEVQLLSSFYTLGDDKTDVTPKKKISDLSWSTGGGYLAIGYSVIYHEIWCDHLSEIRLHQTSHNNTLQEIPERTLEVHSCVTNLSYHPFEPSILAASLFNGDVLIWNLRHEEFSTHFMNPLQVCIHGDTVTSLTWLPKSRIESLIVTTSTDGYINVNKITDDFTKAKLYKKFKIAKEYNPAENSRPRSAAGRRERAAEAGLSLTSLDFSSVVPEIFIVGTLCGGIYKCSLENSVPIESVADDENPLSDPVISEYERHEGSVTCVKCSPTRRTFVSCGTDKEIRLYDFDQMTKLQMINVESTVIKFSWYTKCDHDVIAAYGASSSIDFYGFVEGEIVSKSYMESARENTSCLDFNHKRDLAAVGDTQGKLEIWKTSLPAIVNS